MKGATHPHRASSRPQGISWRGTQPGEGGYLLHTLDRHDGGGRVPMLAFLARQPGAVPVTHLEREFLGVSWRNVRTLADRMTAEGWLERCETAGRVSYRLRPSAALAVLQLVETLNPLGAVVLSGDPDPQGLALELRQYRPGEPWHAPHVKRLCRELRRVL